MFAGLVRKTYSGSWEVAVEKKERKERAEMGGSRALWDFEEYEPLQKLHSPSREQIDFCVRSDSPV